MEPYAVKFTDDSLVGEPGIFDVKENHEIPDDERVKQMINAVAGLGAEEITHRPAQTGRSASQLPGGEPPTDVFEVRSLRRLQNPRGEAVNAAIVEIDKVASDLPLPNQLGLFKYHPPEKLNARWRETLYSSPFETACAFPLCGGNMVLVQTFSTPADKKPEVQVWYPYRNNAFKLEFPPGVYTSEFNVSASSINFRFDIESN